MLGCLRRLPRLKVMLIAQQNKVDRCGHQRCNHRSGYSGSDVYVQSCRGRSTSDGQSVSFEVSPTENFRTSKLHCSSAEIHCPRRGGKAFVINRNRALSDTDTSPESHRSLQSGVSLAILAAAQILRQDCTRLPPP